MNDIENRQIGKEKVRLVFVAVIIGLIAQYMLVGIIGYYQSEPWPAFVLPGFKAVYHDGSSVKLTTYEFFATMEDEPFNEIRVADDQLFKGIPTSMRRGVIVKKFKELQYLTGSNGEFEQWLRVRLADIYPDQVPLQLRMLKKQKRYLQNGDELQLTDEKILENHTIRF